MLKPDYEMNEEEYKALFEKYDLIELDAFGELFKYACPKEIEVPIKISQITYLKKYKALSDEQREDYGNLTRHYTPSVKLLTDKLGILNDHELEFFAKLSAYKLVYVHDNQQDDKQAMEEVYELIDIVNKELMSRKSQVKKTKKDNR